MRAVAQKFYRSPAWRKCRESFIAERMSIDGGMCMRCHKEPGYIVHHKIHLNLGNVEIPEIALCHDNLEFLCMSCHNDEHFHKQQKLKCRFDEKGRPVGNS